MVEPKIWLKRPEKRDQTAVEQMMNAFFENGEEIICGSALLDREKDYSGWLRKIDLAFDENEHDPSWVPYRTFLIMKGDQPVGFLDFRFELNDFLQTHGHIGYSIHPEFRKQGIATAALKKVLPLAKEMNISPVRLSAHESNFASRKVIEKNGGKLIRKVPDGNQTIFVYEIEN